MLKISEMTRRGRGPSLIFPPAMSSLGIGLPQLQNKQHFAQQTLCVIYLNEVNLFVIILDLNRLRIKSSYLSKCVLGMLWGCFTQNSIWILMRENGSKFPMILLFFKQSKTLSRWKWRTPLTNFTNYILRKEAKSNFCELQESFVYFGITRTSWTKKL